MNKRQIKIGLLRIKMKRLHKAFIVSRETSIEYRSHATRALKASHPFEYKLIISLWGKKMAETKKAKASLKAVCDELRELLPAKPKAVWWGEPSSYKGVQFITDHPLLREASKNHMVEFRA